MELRVDPLMLQLYENSFRTARINRAGVEGLEVNPPLSQKSQILKGRAKAG